MSLLEYARAQEVPCSVAHYVNANERRAFVFQRAGLMEDMLCVFTFQTDADFSLGIAVTRFDFGDIPDNNCSCGTIRIFDVTPSGDLLLANTCSRLGDSGVTGPVAAVRSSSNVVVVTLSTQGCPGPNLCLELGDLDDSLFQNSNTTGHTESTSVIASMEETTEGTTITASEINTSTDSWDQSITDSENTQGSIAETTCVNEETTESIETTVEEISSTGSSNEWSIGSESTSTGDFGSTTNEETTQSSVSTTDEDVSAKTTSQELTRSESTTTGNTEGLRAVTDETRVGLGTTWNSLSGSSDLTFPHAGNATPGVVEWTTESYTHARTEETTGMTTNTIRGFGNPTTTSDTWRPGTESPIGPETTTEETETTTKKKKWWWPFG